MVSKVTVNNSRYTNILMGTVQAAVANGVLDAVRAGGIPKEKTNDLGIICSVWLNSSVIIDDNLDHQILFDIHRKAMALAIHKAMTNTPDIAGYWKIKTKNHPQILPDGLGWENLKAQLGCAIVQPISHYFGHPKIHGDFGP